MRRNGSLIGVLFYFAALLAVSVVHAQSIPVIPKDQTFSDWFWHSMDWHSFGSAALAGLMGGALRTMGTLRSMEPTFRVFLETLGDSITALVSGLVVFLLLLVWQNYSGTSVSHVVTFVTALIAGWLRGGFITWFDNFIKKTLAGVTDIVISSVISWAQNFAKVRTNPDKIAEAGPVVTPAPTEEKL